jgi:hypothetical protein
MKQIPDDPVATVGEYAVTHSIVMRSIREGRINRTDVTSRHLNQSYEVILRALEEFQFSSV